MKNNSATYYLQRSFFYSILLLSVLSLFLVACTTTESVSEKTTEQMPAQNDVMHDMNSMPCHQMPDGSWMGDCAANEQELETGSHSEPEHGLESMAGMHSEETFLPGQSLSKEELTALPLAKPSRIIDVQNGDELALTAELIKNTINGKTIVMYGYNAMIPGPAIRAKQGSTITVEFTNNIDWETTVHWHGLRHNIEDDGVPGVSQKPIQPGESHTYSLTFPDDGIYWYHPHVREDVQQDMGLAGNMLVFPTEDYNSVNREELLMLDDILMDETGVVPYGKEHGNYAVMGRYGNTMLINGLENYALSVNHGEIVRFYITNVANVRPFNLHIPGATMKLVGGDLGQYEYETIVDNVILAPAQRAIIDVKFDESGEQKLLHITPQKTYELGTITVSQNPVAISYKEDFTDIENPSVIEDIARFEPYFEKEVDYELVLDINMPSMAHEPMNNMDSMPCHQMPDGSWMGDCTGEDVQHDPLHTTAIEWEDDMNMKMSAEHVEWLIKDSTGKTNMDLDLSASVGDVVKIRLFNDPESMHPMQHPMHLHGQRFIVTHIDGEPVQNKVWMDTILVPIGSTVDILVDVTNPGEWMMHCHIAEHLEAGMMTSFTVTE